MSLNSNLGELKYSSDGLAPFSDRVSIVSGGYCKIGDCIFVDMKFKTNIELPIGYAILTGLPKTNSNWSIIGFSESIIYKTAISTNSEYLSIYETKIPSNTTVHLIGSYDTSM